MKRILKQIMICCLLTLLCWSLLILSDRKKLNNGLIRFHVVANSDSNRDQTIKIIVRDAVLESVEADLIKISDIHEAKQYLQENLPKIQLLVDSTLHNLGFQGGSYVSMCKEKFDIRHYDTFSLPAGIYDSLKIVIGDGLGKNWWCVSFPSLCIPATTNGFRDAAVSAGLSWPLVQTLSRNDDYEIHFFFLNQLGKLENILFHQ